MDVPHVIQGMMLMNGSFPSTLIERISEGNDVQFMTNLVSEYEIGVSSKTSNRTKSISNPKPQGDWLQYVTCINDHVILITLSLGEKKN